MTNKKTKKTSALARSSRSQDKGVGRIPSKNKTAVKSTKLAKSIKKSVKKKIVDSTITNGDSARNTKPNDKKSSIERKLAVQAPTVTAIRRARRVYDILIKNYPDARCALNHRNAYELLVATILSAQCTDQRVNKVTPSLFKAYPNPQSLADASLIDIEEAIRSTGFFRNKAKSIRGASQIIAQQYDGQVPDTMDDLTQLPGVARKTANVVLGNVFEKNEGVVVDTHVSRLSQRIGLTDHSDPNKIEKDLMALFPRETWTQLAHLLIHHGRAICSARKPKCDQCPLANDCQKNGVDGS